MSRIDLSGFQANTANLRARLADQPPLAPRGTGGGLRMVPVAVRRRSGGDLPARGRPGGAAPDGPTRRRLLRIAPDGPSGGRSRG